MQIKKDERNERKKAHHIHDTVLLFKFMVVF